MTQAEMRPSFDSIATFGELLRLAGAAAANANSPTHRAFAVRDIDRLGTAWTGGLSNGRANLAEALIAAIKSLAGATTAEARTAIANSISQLVAAARAEPASTRRHRAITEPRRFWIEMDR